MKYLLFYEPAEKVLEKARPADPREGSMSINRSREGAEEFATGDPFLANGVIVSWSIREWDVAPAP